MQVSVFPIGPLETNCFLASLNGQAVVVDPGGDPSPLLDAMKRGNLTLTHILNTHLHFDHVFGNAPLHKATGAPILANREDDYLMQSELGRGGLWGLPQVEEFTYTHLEPGDTEFLGVTCKVLHTPGHSPGSMTFYFPDFKVAFVGDLIFNRSIGRTDFPGGSHEVLLRSVIDKIFTLPDDVKLYSGHGAATSVGDEKLHNPFFSEYRR